MNSPLVNMAEYSKFSHAESERLLADEEPMCEREISPCPVSTEHNARVRRIGDLLLQVKHNKRDELIIWSWTSDYVVHESLLAEFDKREFSGYQLRPATVRFRDGFVSNDYREVIVVGWGGHARPESGIQLIEKCPGCQLRSYTRLKNTEQLIDWSQWSGEDFFLVWPLPGLTLVTRRVADTLASLKVKSYSLCSLRYLEYMHAARSSPVCFRIPRLSFYLPEDLAIKYGRPLGLE